MTKEVMIEALAVHAHEMWVGWIRYLFSKCLDTPSGMMVLHEAIDYWKREINVSYPELSEADKGIYRVEARKMLEIMGLLSGDGRGTAEAP